ncbi:hypothetical protein HZS_4670 [Henneguya salminicola]|nr:hypothetical protein HZS_4670 [Henneguya salminicola]
MSGSLFQLTIFILNGNGFLLFSISICLVDFSLYLGYRGCEERGEIGEIMRYKPKSFGKHTSVNDATKFTLRFKYSIGLLKNDENLQTQNVEIIWRSLQKR